MCLLLVQITLWLGMAWEDEDSKERALRDPARVKGKLWFGHRWTNALVKKRVIAFSLGTNQAIGSHIVWRIKSSLDFMEKVAWRYDLNLDLLKWFQVTCSRWLFSNGWDNWLSPSSVEDCKKWHLERIGAQVVWFIFFHLILSW
jgi:hypothetical protein